MLRRLISLGVVIGAIWMLGACGPKVVKVNEAQDGSAVALKVGSELMVVLDANPTTGYTWGVDAVDESVLAAQGEPAFEASSDKIGAGGKMTLRFQALGAGETALRLVYHRPWEQDEPPAGVFTLQVTVRP